MSDYTPTERAHVMAQAAKEACRFRATGKPAHLPLNRAERRQAERVMGCWK